MVRKWGYAIGLATGVCVAVSSVFAYASWKENPGGLFRSESGTAWTYVWETFFSWFWPSMAVLVPVAMPGAILCGKFCGAKPKSGDR
ncbi:MAG: hypothetical protein CBD18_05240 [Opitutales bacterium TMED158]|nr:MAG: hypothetical protein CBD18_05240 [Opitutales bacterium TMED158]